MANPLQNQVANLTDRFPEPFPAESFPTEGLLLAFQAPKPAEEPNDVVIVDSATVQFQLPSELTQSLQRHNFRRSTSETELPPASSDTFIDVV